MSKGLKIAEPPTRHIVELPTPEPTTVGEKFRQVRETEMVQFNKRVPRSVADGYELLAIRTRRKVPELLAEGLILLQERYGKI